MFFSWIARRGLDSESPLGVCTREWKGMTVGVLMATPCTKSLGGGSWGHKHSGGERRKLCWKFATERNVLKIPRGDTKRKSYMMFIRNSYYIGE